VSSYNYAGRRANALIQMSNERITPSREIAEETNNARPCRLDHRCRPAGRHQLALREIAMRS
jgi:hypothetical protein